MAFSPDGEHIVTATTEGIADLWNVHTGSLVRKFKGHKEIKKPIRELLTGRVTGEQRLKGIWATAFSADGSQLLTGGDDETAILWDVRDATKLRSFAQRSGRVTYVAFSRDGRRIFTGSHGGTFTMWDSENGAALTTFKVDQSQGFFDVNDDGTYALSGSFRGSVFLWDVQTGAKLKTLVERDGSVVAVKFTPNGRKVLAVFSGQTATVSEISGGSIVRTFGGGSSSASIVDFSSDGNHLLVGYDDNTTMIWNLRSGEKTFTFGSPGFGNDAIFSSDGRRVMAGGGSGGVGVWDIQSRKRINTFGSQEHIRRLGAAANEQFVATGSTTGDIKLWDSQTGRIIREYSGHTGAIKAITFSPDSRKLVTASEDCTAILWSVEAGAAERTLAGHNGEVLSSAFSPDGRYVLTGSQDGTAILWNIDTGRIVHTFRELGGPVFSVAFDLTGQRALVVANDKVQLWNVRTGSEIGTFAERKCGALCAAFTPGEKYIAAGSSDGLVRIMDSKSANVVLTVVSFDRGQDWLAVTPDGLFDGSLGGRERVKFRVGGGLTVVPVDRFFQDFYYPGLLAAIFRGERPMPQSDFGKSRPPSLRIVAPRGDLNTDVDEVTVDVAAIDQGGGIKGPFVRNNGSKVLGAGEAHRQGKTLRQSFKVRLVEGDNLIRVEAASADGSWESEPAKLVIHCSKHLSKPELYVIAAGVSKYADPALSLSFAGKDADSICSLFRDRGKSLYKEVHVTELVDEKATKAGLRQACRRPPRPPSRRIRCSCISPGTASPSGSAITTSRMNSSRRASSLRRTSASKECPATFWPRISGPCRPSSGC